MVRWLGGAAAVLAAVAVVVTFMGRAGRSGPEVVGTGPVSTDPAPVPPVPTPPAQLPAVVLAADIDPLLDPPAVPRIDPAYARPVLTAVGFEEAAAPAPAAAGDPPPIPPAAEDGAVEVAPTPGDVTPLSMAVPASDLRVVRAGWYGELWGTVEGKIADFWAEWTPFSPGFAAPLWESCRGVGVGLYF
jgi:hypothetical protein